MYTVGYFHAKIVRGKYFHLLGIAIRRKIFKVKTFCSVAHVLSA